MKRENELWVCKFGGTSLANARQIMKVRDIVLSDERRKVVIVSAPGKEHPEDTKITDLLYRCHELASRGGDYEDTFAIIKKRFLDIAEALGVGSRIEQELDTVYSRLPKEKTPDFAASRGEYLNALMFAEYLGAEFVDTENVIILTDDGRVDDSSYEQVAGKLSDPQRMYVIPGFFGSNRQGVVKTFSRGGSDITGAIAARAVGADMYENWTDVSGIYMADPRIADEAGPVAEITYREIRELASIGANVFHEDAIAPVRRAGVPITIKNTNDPQASGTLITPERDAAKQQIVGVSGKKPYRKLVMEKFMLDRYPEVPGKLRSILQQHNVTADVVVDAFDAMVFYLAAEMAEPTAQRLKEQIVNELEADVCDVSKPLALVGIVGEGIAELPRLLEEVVGALRKKSIYPAVIAGNTPVKMLLAVEVAAYNETVKTLVSLVS
ncbi:MAG: aspartate kinase [Spirochaetota bacterium]